MLGTIIGAIIVGAIIGALGRLLLPGKQNISLVVTILIGIVANLIVGWGLDFLFGYNNNNGGIAWIRDPHRRHRRCDPHRHLRPDAGRLATSDASRPHENPVALRPGSSCRQDSRPRWYASLTAAARSLTPSFS